VIFFWAPQHRYRCGPGDSIGFFRVGAAVCGGWRATREGWPRCRALAPAIGAADVVWSAKLRSSASHTCSSGGSVPQPKDGWTLCRPQDTPGTEAVSAEPPGHRIEWPHGTRDSLLLRGRERKGVRGGYYLGMARAREDGWSSCGSVRPAKAGMLSGKQSHRGKSQIPVAWVASVEETKRRKPTDQAILGMVSESPGRNASEPTSGLEKNELRRPSPLVRGEGSMACGSLTDAAWHFGGVVGTAR